MQRQAAGAVNRSLTIRNWLIGFYIVEFEQHGEDRARYGNQLLDIIAAQLKERNIRGLTAPELSRCRQFYSVYPQILGALSQKSVSGLQQILGTVSQEFVAKEKSASEAAVPAAQLINSLSFSHLVELIKIDDPLKRTFYEIECIKGAWSIRELRRQMASLYFERSGMSRKPEALSAKTAQRAEALQPADIVKSVYVFEFLGLRAKDVMEESDLETALLDHLQAFLLELGHGFCFEARQKKILIGDRYYFVDLVLYHRILKCHVLVDLKVGEFDHADAGQINTYLNYYRKEVSDPTDNPPVGILLVTNKNEALVEYATAGMDNRLFVSKYLVQLPSKERLLQFVKEQLKQL